jgi:hypothetical protein
MASLAREQYADVCWLMLTSADVCGIRSYGKSGKRAKPSYFSFSEGKEQNERLRKRQGSTSGRKRRWGEQRGRRVLTLYHSVSTLFILFARLPKEEGALKRSVWKGKGAANATWGMCFA